jgi:hypothetical protein
MLKLVDDKSIFRSFTGILEHSAACYANMDSPKLSYAA